MATAAPTLAPTSDPEAITKWESQLLITQSVLSSIAAILCIQVLIVLTQRYRLRILHDRLILGVFAHSLIFTIVAAIPFDYENSAYSNADYCWWRGMWFASSYGVLMYINLIILAVIYALNTGRDFTVRFEVCGHVFAFMVFISCLGGFAGRCYEIYATNLSATDDMESEGTKVVYDLFFPAMQTWVVLILLGLIMWLWTWRYTSNLEKLWLAHTESLEYLEDEQLRDEERGKEVITLTKYGWVIRPLRLYPIVFLVFGLPAVAFFADGCYTSMACLRGVEFVLVFRTYAIYLGFLFSSPRNWLEAWSVHIILAKRLGVSLILNRDNVEHYAMKGRPHGRSPFPDDDDACDDVVYEKHMSVEYNAFRDDNNLLRSYTMETPSRSARSVAVRSPNSPTAHVFVEAEC